MNFHEVHFWLKIVLEASIFCLFFEGHLFKEGFNAAFILTFANEWGDRSQITNMALAAKDVLFRNCHN